ncbi:MAG TPA: hypothetical protein VJN18_32275 [Polyangiaceae bacterium]|nr:hypothetical protein [Polyangiaceae bacterium]
MVGSGLCPENCDGALGKRNENKVTRKEVLVAGAVIGGSTVIRTLDEAHVSMTCGGCGNPYIANRATVIKARLNNRVTRCSVCLANSAPEVA